MNIVRKELQPSREDAERLTRTEKMAMLSLAHAATILDDLQAELGDRLKMIDRGGARIRCASEMTDGVLQDLRLTIPMNQRKHLQNTAMDYECRIVPKATPGTTNVIMEKEEFRELVDNARVKCRDCTEDDEQCASCSLYRVLTSVLPLDSYHHGLLCPYNLGEWAE